MNPTKLEVVQKTLLYNFVVCLVHAMATEGHLSKADLDHRFDCLASFTQDPDSHLFFAPGMKWWLCNPHKRAKEDVVTVFEQVDATEADMESAYGTRWANKFAAFNAFLAKLTGLSLREKKNTLKKMTEGTMPDFGVYCVEVIIKGKKVERQCVCIKSITNVVCDRIITLLEAGVLIPALKLTTLDDETIMVRFMGDKGGPFMSTKFGLTVMNCRDPNSADSFDLCASLDAPDTYNNLKVGIFDHYKDELDFYFDLDYPPRLFLLSSDDKVLAAIAYKEDGQEIEAVWTEAKVVPFPKSTTDSTNQHVGGPYSISGGTQMQLLEEDNVVWGLRILNTGRDDGNVLEFRTQVSIAACQEVSTMDYNLHTVLGGDIDFLNCVIGLQNCSASYPCNKCLMKLLTLRERAPNMHEPPPAERTREKQKEFLANVEKESNPLKRKDVAKGNGSTLRAPLINVNFSRLLIAVLHIILGIVKKIFDNLIDGLQRIDNKGDCSERMKLTKVRDVIFDRAKYLEEHHEELKKDLEESEKEKKKAFEAWKTARQEAKPMKEIEQKKKAHVEAVQDFKMKQEAYRCRDKTIVAKLNQIIDEINAYLKHNRGKFEGLLEKIIASSPIKAKHNPFYSGSFNGNDCFRLLENYELIFNELLKAAEEEEEQVKKQLLDMLAIHQRIFAAVAALVPSFRSTKRLSPLQQNNVAGKHQGILERVHGGAGFCHNEDSHACFPYSQAT